MNLPKTIRRLIVVEIALLVVVVAAAFAEERFLPAELQSYLAAEAESPWTACDWVFVAVGVPLFVLIIVSWVALWRGWPTARFLYTLTWGLSLPLYGIGAPFITGPFGSVLQAASCLVSGMLLGLLYFSDFRRAHEPTVA